MVAKGLAVVFAVAALALGAFLAYDRLGTGGDSSGSAATAPTPTSAWEALRLDKRYEICERALQHWADTRFKALLPVTYYASCIECGPAATWPGETPDGDFIAKWWCGP
jgi:hypothetical protein